LGGSSEALDGVAGLIDWRPVAALLSKLRSGAMGAPAYPSLLLFKALLLQRWYALSDPALEEELKDRLSFRRFVGLSLTEAIPDHSTLWRFRESLNDGLGEKLFVEIARQIEAGGFVLEQGTLIDASLVPSAVNPPRRPDAELPPDAQGRPASKLVRSQDDPDAAWTKKENKYHFGYKLHVAMDKTSRIIRRLVLTPANINESAPSMPTRLMTAKIAAHRSPDAVSPTASCAEAIPNGLSPPPNCAATNAWPNIAAPSSRSSASSRTSTACAAPDTEVYPATPPPSSSLPSP
jgi:IS5 family transposase